MFGIFCVPFLGSFWQLVHSIVTVGVGRLVVFQFVACILYSPMVSNKAISPFKCCLGKFPVLLFFLNSYFVGGEGVGA